MDVQEVTVAVQSEYLSKFDEVVSRCEMVGLTVGQRLPGIGVVSGRIDVAKIPALERVEGVAAVEIGRDYQLPPPDSDIQ